MGASSAMTKCTLFFVNLLICIEGLVLLLAGIVIRISATQNGESYHYPALLVGTSCIVLGGCLFVMATFGCCGALNESTCMLTTTAIVLSSLLVMQLLGAILIFISLYRVNDALEKSLDKYGIDDDATKLWDSMHIVCCRVNSTSNYTEQGLNVPSACTCDDMSESCKSRQHLKACFHAVTEVISTLNPTLLAVGLILVSIKLVGALLSFRLASASRNGLQGDRQILLSEFQY